MRHKRKLQGSSRPAPAGGSAGGPSGRPNGGSGRRNGPGKSEQPNKGSSREDRLYRALLAPDGPPPMPPVNRDRAHLDPLIGEALLGRGPIKKRDGSRFDRRQR